VIQSKKQFNYAESFPIFAGVAAMLLWSTTAVANKIAIIYMDGLSAGILRSMLAGVLALIIACLLKYPFPKTTLDRLLLLLTGVTSFGLWPALISIGIEQTSVSHAALIMALIPIFTVIFSALIEMKIPSLRWWIGALIALFATVILIFSRFGLDTSSSNEAYIKGDLIILAGALVCAIGYVAGGKLSPKVGTEATTFWGLSISLIFLIPTFIQISGNTFWANVSLVGWGAIFWMALCSSLGGYILWFLALGRGGIQRIGSILLVMPVITLFFANVVLNEPITVYMLMICACIVFGTYQAQKHAK